MPVGEQVTEMDTTPLLEHSGRGIPGGGSVNQSEVQAWANEVVVVLRMMERTADSSLTLLDTADVTQADVALVVRSLRRLVKHIEIAVAPEGK